MILYAMQFCEGGIPGAPVLFTSREQLGRRMAKAAAANRLDTDAYGRQLTPADRFHLAHGRAHYIGDESGKYELRAWRVAVTRPTKGRRPERAP
jgi:hypothetical protein